MIEFEIVNKLNVAFDWGGALEINESLRKLARELYAAGYGVFVIPALGLWEFPYEERLKDLQVPFHGVHRVRLDPSFPEAVAVAKVEMMKQLKCTVLYDDNQCNVDAARKAGFAAVLVNGNTEVERTANYYGEHHVAVER